MLFSIETKGAADVKELMCAWLREAGRYILERSKFQVHEKAGWNDFVTDADVAVQNLLHGRIREKFPEASFFMEEGEKESVGNGLVFCIDPIDGTTNFIRDRACSCISVGVMMNKEPVEAFVYDPYRDFLYYAKKGEGAYLNDQPIHVSDKPMDHAVVALGTSPYHRSLVPKTLEMITEFFSRAGDIRRCGSAALDICDVAAGRSDVFSELTLMPWDYCAGALIVKEAGGEIINPFGALSFTQPCGILASNQVCFEEAKAVMRKITL